MARQAGATNVINPVSFTGLLLAGSAHGEHIADYMADLASVSGNVHIAERVISSEEVGKSARVLEGDRLVVRIYRDGKQYGFWETEAQQLQQGDIVVEVIPDPA